MKFNIGSELDKQIYKEGEPTWGCKSGVLDVEDVSDFIKQCELEFLKRFGTNAGMIPINIMRKIAGEKLI